MPMRVYLASRSALLAPTMSIGPADTGREPLSVLKPDGAVAEARALDPARLLDHFDRLCRAAFALSGTREDAEDLV
jgi:hypothetical protein